jgi:hypothetical protein
MSLVFVMQMAHSIDGFQGQADDVWDWNTDLYYFCKLKSLSLAGGHRASSHPSDRVKVVFFKILFFFKLLNGP